MEISIGGVPKGRVTLRLYDEMAPKTVKNFKALCTGECGLGATTKKPLHYKGCPVHRVIPGFMIQGGDFSNKNGTGGESIYGGKFADEPFAVRHTRSGLLSMANAGPDTNGSQFFVTLAPTPHLDNKHVCFGEVSGGMEIIRAVEKVDTYRRDEPAAAQRVLITDCGVKREGQDFETAVAARDVASQKKKEKKEKKKSKKEEKKKAEKKAKKDAKKAAKKQAKDEKKKAKKQEKEPENDTPRSRAPESNGGRYYPADRPRADSYGDRPRSGDRPRADSYGDRPRADSYGDRSRPRVDSFGRNGGRSRSPPRRRYDSPPRRSPPHRRYDSPPRRSPPRRRYDSPPRRSPPRRRDDSPPRRRDDSPRGRPPAPAPRYGDEPPARRGRNSSSSSRSSSSSISSRRGRDSSDSRDRRPRSRSRSPYRYRG